MLLSTAIPEKKLNRRSIGTDENKVPFPLRFREHSIRSDRTQEPGYGENGCEILSSGHDTTIVIVNLQFHSSCYCLPQDSRGYLILEGKSFMRPLLLPGGPLTTDGFLTRGSHYHLMFTLRCVHQAPLGSSIPMVTQVAPVILSGSQSKTKKKWIQLRGSGRRQKEIKVAERSESIIYMYGADNLTRKTVQPANTFVLK